MLEEQLRGAGRELRALTESYVRDTPLRDRLADVRHRRAVRRRRRQVVVGTAAALLVFAASAAVFATTRPDSGRVITAEPGGVDDRAAIEATIRAMFETVHSVEDGLALIDEPAGLAGVMEAAQSDPRAALTLRIDIGSIDLSGDSAIADVSYYLSGNLAATKPEISLVKRDGRWLLTRASYCEVVSAAVQCPAPGETYTPTTSTSILATSGGPTQEDIAATMRHTTLEDGPDQYFVPFDTPITISDGFGGTLTAVIGGRANTGDGSGQLVFFWHDDAFLGWDKDHEALKLRLSVESANGPAFRVSYAYLRDGEPACCPTGTVDVVYAWDGLKIAPDQDLPPETAGAKVRIAG
jgi:hypothetical protein